MYRRVKARDIMSSGRESAQINLMARNAGKKMKKATTTSVASASLAAVLGSGAQCGSRLYGKDVMSSAGVRRRPSGKNVRAGARSLPAGEEGWT